MFDTELGNALDFLAQQHDINIVLDTAHLEALGIGSNTSVNASLKGISLQSAVNLVLSEFDLTFVVEYEVLPITSQERLDDMPITRGYDVSQLLGEDQDARAIVKMMQSIQMPRRQSREQLSRDFPIFAYNN